MKKNLALLFSVIIFTALIGFGFFGINGVLAADALSPTNLIVTPGDSCVAALQPTLSWDLSAAVWFSKGWAWSTNIRWISFNSSNCDTDNDGTSNGGSGCPVAGTAMSAYSVKIDSGNGKIGR